MQFQFFAGILLILLIIVENLADVETRVENKLIASTSVKAK